MKQSVEFFGGHPVEQDPASKNNLQAQLYVIGKNSDGFQPEPINHAFEGEGAAVVEYDGRSDHLKVYSPNTEIKDYIMVDLKTNRFVLAKDSGEMETLVGSEVLDPLAGTIKIYEFTGVNLADILSVAEQIRKRKTAKETRNN